MKKFYAVFFVLLCVAQLQAQVADFSFTAPGGSFCSPVAVQFTQNCSGTPVGYIWDFGNGRTSNQPNPVFNFTTTGNYAVKLTAIYDQFTATITKNVAVYPPVTTSIAANTNYICKPGSISFTAGGNANNFSWDFGDGSGPVAGNAMQTHSYNSFGSFTAVVTASSAAGCSASASINVQVKAPGIAASASPVNGCIPAATNFTASVDVPPGSTITNYAWDFGDGSQGATTTPATTHPYVSTGSFTPTLTITTSDGCTGTDTIDAVAFGTPPVNQYAYVLQDTVCGSDALQFGALATNATHYNWVWNDGNNTAVSDTTVQYKYRTLGAKTITMTPYFNGCAGAPVNLQAFVKGVIASYSQLNTCSNKNAFTFYNICQGNVSVFTWNFGDGTTLANVPTVTHTYTTAGAYTASISATDSITGCSDSYSDKIYISTPQLFTGKTSACKNDSVIFTVHSQTANSNALYAWHVLGDTTGPISDSTITRAADSFGVYNNYVVIDNGPAYCKDTIRQAQPFMVKGPVLQFEIPESLCVNAALIMNNLSAPYNTADSIRSWIWNFGDGKKDSLFNPVPHKYADTASYAVQLSATDIHGCKASLDTSLTVNAAPFIRTLPLMDTVCLGQTISLFAFHSDSLHWQPASLVSCATCDTVQASPASTTQFIATASNALGCSAADTTFVKVFAPFTATASFTDSSVCINDSIRLQAGPPDKLITWSTATGLFAATHTPTAVPAESTRYLAVLTDSAGCFSDSIAINIIVDTLPVVNAGPDRTLPFNTVYDHAPVYSPGVTQYAWSPGALLTCTGCPLPRGRASYTETFTVTAISDKGCVAKDSVTIMVACDLANLLMPTAFSPDYNGLNDVYYPLTRGVKTIRNFIIYNRLGQVVFKAQNFPPNNKKFGWDGNVKGQPQAIGSYVYVLEAVCEAGENMRTKGMFMLLR